MADVVIANIEIASLTLAMTRGGDSFVASFLAMTINANNAD